MSCCTRPRTRRFVWRFIRCLIFLFISSQVRKPRIGLPTGLWWVTFRNHWRPTSFKTAEACSLTERRPWLTCWTSQPWKLSKIRRLTRHTHCFVMSLNASSTDRKTNF
ncbi:JM46 [macacine gammaherpesvirus 11]|uniref:JM46 n=2 Tax=macacine gammaherpesvirus 11 TaxID=2560570 RepID=G9JMM4_9GAMA|nr:JM46 [Macaca fuscata rhadinovirus]AAT00023.1 JM46 [Macaca fuscata rhadinovirus]AEW87571.1 JM46 [Macaca fuscata rhadinovirus]AEW87741.1 JM46 [Macaca fuscata rhadinovirus]